MTVHLNHRGWVAVIIATTLGIVLIIMVGAVAAGVAVSEIGRSAAFALVGALAGALVTYLTATSNGGAPKQ
jgi:hypothetical protein